MQLLRKVKQLDSDNELDEDSVRRARKSSELRRCFSLSAQEEHTRKHATSFKIVHDGECVRTPPPNTWLKEDRKYLPLPRSQYTFPPIYLGTFKDAYLIGGSNLLIHQERVITNDLFKMQSEYTCEEQHGFAELDSEKGEISLSIEGEHYSQFEEAASFLDALSANYAHWLSEVLTKVAIFAEYSDSFGVPLVVNDELHDSMYESILAVCGFNQNMLMLPRGEVLRVNRLHQVSCTGYVPYSERQKEGQAAGNAEYGSYMPRGALSPFAMQLMRRRILKNIEGVVPASESKRIYVRRNSGYRQIVNQDEIELMLLDRGFTVIEPEKMSFCEQVMCFSNAEVIFSSSGAACANLLFCQPEARMYLLGARNMGTPYYYWQHYACAANRKMTYVLGEKTDTGMSGIHSDFEIDLKDIEAILR